MDKELTTTDELINRGRFAEAVREIDRFDIPGARRITTDVQRAFLFERTGDHGRANRLADKLLRSSQITSWHRSLLEQVVGMVANESGDRGTARIHLQHAVELAKESADLERICWAELRLWSFLCDDQGPDSLAPLLSDLRANSIRAANPIVTAAVHAYVGECEAKLGRSNSARWHTKMAKEILERNENLWLEAVAENTELAVAATLSQYELARGHGLKAAALAEQSGVSATRRACLGNLANVLFFQGDFDAARAQFQLAKNAFATAGENANAHTETLARIALLEGDLTKSEELLDELDRAFKHPADQSLYVYRYGRLTRAQLLLRSGKLDQALKMVDHVAKCAASVCDFRISALARVVKGEILIHLGSVSGALEQIEILCPTLAAADVDVYGSYLRLCSLVAAKTGDAAAALSHHAEAKRLYDIVGDGRGLAELTTFLSPTLSQVQIGAGPEVGSDAHKSRELLVSVGTALLFADRPEVVAGMIRTALEDADAIVSGTWSDTVPPTPRPGDVCWPMSNGGKSRAIAFTPVQEVGALAAVNAAWLLFNAAGELIRARREKHTASAAWPALADNLSGTSVVSRGQMAELLDLAGRVARTNVTVLITGESGTGKEILARAIHGFSPRSAKPFIPFNCTAVARDLIEGQMFGHRRGAFTGAEHDNAGIIRTAEGGTLFLDEIGELGVDLQPKLLRFFESGEILPVGDNQPITVDVRVVAATNRDLEQLVAAGTFREDLFYRLNVVRLRVPPLRERRDEIPALVEHFARRAAQDYDKGDIQISGDTMEYLLLFRWPGNIRQLANELRRVVVMAERNAIINPEDLSGFITTGTIKPAPGQKPPQPTEIVVRIDQSLAHATEHLERAMLAYALKQSGGKLEEAASALGLSRKGLYLKRQRLGME